MSTFDQASLVMIPSGYKTSKVYSIKPTDGSGDLVVSRSNDTATRVGPDGLIEKVRTNLSFYSEQFDNGFWNKLGTGLTVTANTTIAPNGTLTADTLNVSNNDNVLYGSRSTALAGNEFTFSIYAKGTGTFGMNVRLNSVTTTTQTKTLTSDWQRFSVSVTNSAPVTSVEFFLDLNTSSTYIVWGAQVESSPVATPYIATTSAAVSVGPVANVPRLDYLNSSCPRLLLEPQRTSLVTFSESFNNAAWGDAGITITANQAVSPDGYTNADLAVSSSSVNYLYQGLGSPFSGTYTVSIFAKKGSQSSFAFGMVAGGFTGGMGVKFNFDTQTFSTPTNYGNFTSISASYQSYGNGWYRLNLTGTTATSTTYFFVLGSLQESFAVNAYVYGAQVEAGAYATSYIPTLGAAVTRGADACSKTGISSLIGQTNGTFFVDVTFGNSNSSWFFSLASTTWTDDSFYLETFGGSNYIAVSTVKSGSAAGGSLSTFSALAGGRAKIAVQYTSTTLNMFINGVKYTGTRTAIPTCTGLYLNEIGTFGAGSNQYNANRFNQVLTFTSTLTDAQCIELTTL